jgi:hypothetical protein
MSSRVEGRLWDGRAAGNNRFIIAKTMSGSMYFNSPEVTAVGGAISDNLERAPKGPKHEFSQILY